MRLADRVANAGPWFHQIDLGDTLTPGQTSIRDLKARAEILFGMGVDGRSVLDVGAWDGFYSFEAERRGACSVLAADKFAWGYGGWGNKAAFHLAREILRSNVNDVILDVDEITVDRIGPWDIVLFNGIFYHILDPVHALTQMVRIARYVVTVETHLDNLSIPRPVMTFFPGVEQRQNGEPTNGWGPNSRLMHALLRRLGCEEVLEFPTPDNPEQRSIFLCFKPEHPFGDFVALHRDLLRPRFSGQERSREWETERTELLAQLAASQAELETLQSSTSWRMTEPLRRLVRVVSFNKSFRGRRV
jgi:tRNA (mo5U34)-methyltransferase